MPENPDDRYCHLDGDENSPPRYQPKPVHMPDISDSESDYDRKLFREAVANKAQMQQVYNEINPEKSESSEELDIGAPG